MSKLNDVLKGQQTEIVVPFLIGNDDTESLWRRWLRLQREYAIRCWRKGDLLLVRGSVMTGSNKIFV